MRHIVTKKPLSYAGRKYLPGEAVDLRPKDGRLFRALGRAIEAPSHAPVPTKPIAATPVAPAPVEEDQEDETETESDSDTNNRALEAEPINDPAKTKRAYKRRDLTTGK